MPERYKQPGWFTRHVFNSLVAALTGLGVSVLGSRVLAVKGRKSGEWRTTPVNVLQVGDRRYLVSPRGQTQWVRNLRAAGEAKLRLGRKTEDVRATELPDGDKPQNPAAPTSVVGGSKSGHSSAGLVQRRPTRSCAGSPASTPYS